MIYTKSHDTRTDGEAEETKRESISTPVMNAGQKGYLSGISGEESSLKVVKFLKPFTAFALGRNDVESKEH